MSADQPAAPHGRSSPRADRPRLSREDWIAGALAMCGELGFDRVAAEPLAARLGVTKGSFYWHFASRDELLRAMLDSWEASTHAVIAQLETLRDRADADPLAVLTRGSFERTLRDRSEWAILAATNVEQVRPVVARVHAARISYLSTLWADRGLPPERARARGRVTYAAYLGHQMLLAHGETQLSQPVVEDYLAELARLSTAE